MVKGFKDFILRGNVVDLAVAVVIGAAFATVITSFTAGVINPLIASAGGGDSPGLGFFVREGNAATFVDFGGIITALINFVIVAAVIYFVIVVPIGHLMERRKRGEEPEVVATPEDIALLQEIRDLLKVQPGRTP
ncbi:MAG TPA: large conductance mechanosensitive channel protein MscL [Actinomycetales bacterium]|nr:large conductance mechanosensitive channel protein MscL [Actinomycetales bacterium]